MDMDFITNNLPFNSYDSILMVVDWLIKTIHFLPYMKKINKIIESLFTGHIFGTMTSFMRLF
jgi:hypothetical protein